MWDGDAVQLSLGELLAEEEKRKGYEQAAAGAAVVGTAALIAGLGQRRMAGSAPAMEAVATHLKRLEPNVVGDVDVRPYEPGGAPLPEMGNKQPLLSGDAQPGYQRPPVAVNPMVAETELGKKLAELVTGGYVLEMKDVQPLLSNPMFGSNTPTRAATQLSVLMQRTPESRLRNAAAALEEAGLTAIPSWEIPGDRRGADLLVEKKIAHPSEWLNDARLWLHGNREMPEGPYQRHHYESILDSVGHHPDFYAVQKDAESADSMIASAMQYRMAGGKEKDYGKELHALKSLAAVEQLNDREIGELSVLYKHRRGDLIEDYIKYRGAERGVDTSGFVVGEFPHPNKFGLHQHYPGRPKQLHREWQPDFHVNTFEPELVEKWKSEGRWLPEHVPAAPSEVPRAQAEAPRRKIRFGRR